MVLDAAKWPCLGRDEECARIVALVRSGRSVLIAGAAGVGKSHLVASCVSLLRDAGSTVESRTWSQGSVASPAADPHAVVVIEDIHLLTEGEAAELHGGCVEGGPPFVLTLRTGQRVAAPITALWADNGVDRIDLAPLSTAQIDDLLVAVLGGQVDEALTTRLKQRCEGNLLYLRELVLGGVELDIIYDDDGIWRAHHDWPVPPRLAEIVSSRLDRLDPAELAALELVAFAGTVGTAEVEDLIAPGMVESLERKRFLRTETDARRLRVSVARLLDAEVVVAATPVIRQRQLARQLAELVEEKGCRRAGDVLRVATWRLAGGGGSPLALLDGARAARSAHRFQLAEQLARAAVAEGAGFEAELLAAKLVGLQGGDHECQQALLELADRARTEEQRVAVELARAEHRAIWMGSLGLGGRGDMPVANAASRRELWARRAGTLLLTEGPAAAVTEATSLLGDPNDGVRSWAAIVLGYSLARVGRCQEALDVASSGQATHSGLEWFSSWDRWWHAFNRTEGLLQIGRLADAHALALTNYEQALVTPSPEEQAFFGWQLCKISAERGLLDSAAHYGKVSSALFRDLGRSAYVRVAQVSLALTWARAGQPERASRVLAEVDRSELPIPSIAEIDLWRARAWCSAMSGALADARGHLEQAGTIGVGSGDLAGEAAAQHDLVRLGSGPEPVARLSELVVNTDSRLVAARYMHAQAYQAGDPDALLQASEGFNALGARLLAAEAGADAAVCWQRAGRPRPAAAAEQQAHRLLADCVGAQAFGVETRAARSVLSPGEHETAAIAAAGKSNREIAAQLQLSQRTVENRLQRVYDKLGVHGREDLADALGLTAPEPE